jgi:hypothetical protein
MMFGTLKQVEHYVRTNFGDSTKSYACIEIPFQGVYQGNGAGPGIWMLVSIPIINMLKAAGFGFKVINAMSKETFSFVCYAFVDDTDLVHSLEYESEEHESKAAQLIEEMQSVVDTWEGGLRASGGALVPSKSYWYLIHFKFLNNQWKYTTIQETPGELTIRNVSGLDRVTLERLEVSEARETLGVFIAMDGNQLTQMAELLIKTHRWADRVRVGRLTHAEAWFSLTLCMMKTLEYPLMATSLTQKQCDQIMQPVLDAGLKALGISRTLNRDVVYGPKRYQGLGIPDLWLTQGILKLWIAIAHGDAATITGSSLRAVLALHTLELGLPGSFLLHDYNTFQHLATDSWLKHLWHFCHESQIHLHPSSPSIPLAREYDEFLMIQFSKYGYRSEELYHLNLCRLWCRAVRLSDITTGDGTRIHPLAWNGFSPEDSGSEFEWPQHGKPTNKCWQLWHTALRSCFLTLETPQQRLRRPLGSWLTEAPSTWHWYYSPAQKRVYYTQPDNTGYDVYSMKPTVRRLRSPKYVKTTTCKELPEDSERTTVSEQPTFIWCHGSRPSLFHRPHPTTVSALISENDQWSVRSLDCPSNGAHVAQAIIQGNAVAICDGSYKDKFGTAGFAIQQWANRDKRIIGANVTPGHPDDQNPYRSEIGGIFAIVVIVEALVKLYTITHGTIELGCDCESGLTAVFKHTYDTPNQPHHDLIHEIRRKIASSPVTWKFRHVRGHQDKHIPFHLLDRWSQLNVEMDTLAKVYWNETSTTVSPFYPDNSSGWSIWTDERKLSTWDRKELYNHANSHDILAHWSKRRRIPHQLIRSINWEAGEDAIRRLGLNKSLWIPKWLAGFSPVGKVMQRYKLQDHAECPRCATCSCAKLHTPLPNGMRPSVACRYGLLKSPPCQIYNTPSSTIYLLGTGVTHQLSLSITGPESTISSRPREP